MTDPTPEEQKRIHDGMNCHWRALASRIQECLTTVAHLWEDAQEITSTNGRFSNEDEASQSLSVHLGRVNKALSEANRLASNEAGRYAKLVDAMPDVPFERSVAS